MRLLLHMRVVLLCLAPHAIKDVVHRLQLAPILLLLQPLELLLPKLHRVANRLFLHLNFAPHISKLRHHLGTLCWLSLHRRRWLLLLLLVLLLLVLLVLLLVLLLLLLLLLVLLLLLLLLLQLLLLLLLHAWNWRRGWLVLLLVGHCWDRR